MDARCCHTIAFESLERFAFQAMPAVSRFGFFIYMAESSRQRESNPRRVAVIVMPNAARARRRAGVLARVPRRAGMRVFWKVHCSLSSESRNASDDFVSRWLACEEMNLSCRAGPAGPSGPNGQSVDLAIKAQSPAGVREDPGAFVHAGRIAAALLLAKRFPGRC